MIVVDHLVKKYGNNLAVDDVSFKINKGEIVGFLGPNGAGKSTVLNIMTGYLSATSGTVSILGNDIIDNPIESKKNIGYLPEIPPLYPDMTVKEYLSFVYSLKKCKLNKKLHLFDICDVLKIHDVYNRPISQLSKGYKQRVGIAQALIGNPEILILDEPTVGLDPTQIVEIRNLISDLKHKHTIIFSSHILSEVQLVCDRLIIINNGKIVVDGNMSELNAVTGSRKMWVKAVGDRDAIGTSLANIPGVINCEFVSAVNSKTGTYLVESASNVDVRKKIVQTLSKDDMYLVGLEAAGNTLEDVFIALVDNNSSER